MKKTIAELLALFAENSNDEAKITEALGGEGVSLLAGKDGDYIPRSRLNDVSEKLKAKDDELAKYSETIKALEKDAKDSPELKKQIEELQLSIKSDREKHEASTKALERKYLLDAELVKHKSRDSKLVATLLDADNLEIKDGKILGFDEKIAEIKKSHDYLFEAATLPPPNQGKQLNGSTTGGSPSDDPRFAAALKM
jgi:Phage minor structural protein GP20.